MNCRTGIHALLMSLLLSSSISSAEMVESSSSSLSKSILRGGSSRVSNDVYGDANVFIHSAAIERHLNGTDHPPPNDSHKHHSGSSGKSSGGSSSGSSSGGSSSGGSSSGGSSGSGGGSSSSGSSSKSSTKPPPPKSSGYMHFGMAAVTVVGVAAFYTNKNRQIVTEEPPEHSLKGSLAKRMQRFHNLAGKANRQARGNGNYSFDDESQAYTCDSNAESEICNMYVEMSSTTGSSVDPSESQTAGRSTMASV